MSKKRKKRKRGISAFEQRRQDQAALPETGKNPPGFSKMTPAQKAKAILAQPTTGGDVSKLSNAELAQRSNSGDKEAWKELSKRAESGDVDAMRNHPEYKNSVDDFVAEGTVEGSDGKTYLKDSPGARKNSSDRQTKKGKDKKASSTHSPSGYKIGGASHKAEIAFYKAGGGSKGSAAALKAFGKSHSGNWRSQPRDPRTGKWIKR